MDYDLIISGAGPAGLCLARALSGQGLRIALIEQQPEASLAKPAFDGREIALTQRSAETMRELGLWQRIERYDPAALAPLRDARVMNGPSPFAMVIGHQLTPRHELGWLVSNHLIRQAAFDELAACCARNGDITLLTGVSVQQVRSDARQAQVLLSDGQELSAALLVAADSRFSTTRRAMGIAASMHDFGRTMLVCCMTHEQPHHHQAWEWFDYGQTLALLPMNDEPGTGLHRSSVVLTLASHAIEPLMGMDAEGFNLEIARRFKHRLGAMQLVSTKHAYPLVAVYPKRMIAQRFACVGDAAVGMHPVTAHGFNFGLLGIATLSANLLRAHAAGRDLGADSLLRDYESRHRRATLPLFLATQAITRLYTDDSLPAKLLRNAALRVADKARPFKQAVAGSLMGA